MRKLRNDPPAVDLSDRLPVLVRCLAEEPGLVALLLYGSYGTERQGPMSDVDLAVVFQPDQQPSARDRLRLTEAVSHLLTEEDVSLTFRERVVDRYCDFVLDYRVILEDYDERLRLEYGAG